LTTRSGTRRCSARTASGLLDGDIAQGFFEKVLALARVKSLLSDEQFTVDGTLVEAWAGHKSFKKKGPKTTKPLDDPGNPTVDFSGDKRCNDTHASTTDPDAKLYRKSFGTESNLCYWGCVLIQGFPDCSTLPHRA
jgi:hypothetical protein